MPASRPAAILVLLVFVIGSLTLSGNSPRVAWPSNSQVSSVSASSSSLGAALQWLDTNQNSDGSYGAFEEHHAAAAAYALWLNDSDSARAALSYLWLATQLNSSSAWFWGAEADVPGAVLYSIASSHNLDLVNKTLVTDQLLQLQDSTTGGFEGYSYCSSNCDTASPTYRTVASSVDTDMALLGLSGANLIPAENRTAAVRYLNSLQNPDGSFNLTSSRTYDSIYSLGPDSMSITALTILALRHAGVGPHDSNFSKVSMAVEFLAKAASTGFEGHVYSAALSTLAFDAFNQTNDVISSILFILSHQNCDGGFSDSSRSSAQSNVLDTGWAAIALQTRFQGGNSNPLANSRRVNCPPIAAFTITPRAPTAGVSVHFNASASQDSDLDQLSYNWTFGDGSTADIVSPTHTYSQAGSFTVTLTVIDSGTNPGPLSNTKSLSITVQPTTVRGTSTLPFSPTGFLILAGVAALAVIIGVAFYLGRKSVREPIASGV